MAPRLGIFLIWAGACVFLQLDHVDGGWKDCVEEGENASFPHMRSTWKPQALPRLPQLVPFTSPPLDNMRKFFYEALSHPFLTMSNVCFPLSIVVKHMTIAQLLGVCLGCLGVQSLLTMMRMEVGNIASNKRTVKSLSYDLKVHNLLSVTHPKPA
ncbi:hypothetical protein HPG69_009180 [Diceros bicornis minor]|uniref:Uncharacterized protein n=1 Tax=Diceros bicornis minor TaxID=77932 RepID=A0A7J7EZX5_DICBM|nr:hypothetical protein HPG69_009180 [Diceros bicornis minor]